MSFSRKIYPPAPKPAPLYPPGYVPPKGFRLTADGRLETDGHQPPPPPAPPAAQLQDGESDDAEVTGLVDLGAAIGVARRLAQRELAARCSPGPMQPCGPVTMQPGQQLVGQRIVAAEGEPHVVVPHGANGVAVDGCDLVVQGREAG